MKRFHGIDASKQISLFEYGMIIRELHKGEYDIIYGIGKGKHDNFITFSRATYWETDLVELINESWFDKCGFFDYLGQSEQQWLDSTMVMKLWDIKTYYGPENIFGTIYWTETKEWAARITKTKLN